MIPLISPSVQKTAVQLSQLSQKKCVCKENMFFSKSQWVFTKKVYVFFRADDLQKKNDVDNGLMIHVFWAMLN